MIRFLRRSARDDAPWSKPRFLAVFWSAQTALAYFLWPLLFMGADLAEWWGIIGQWGYAAIILPVLLAIMAAQAILLMPIRKPAEPGGGWHARWSRAAMGGLAIGAMTGYLWALAGEALSEWGREIWLGRITDSPCPFLIPLGIATPVATLLLAWLFRRGAPVLLTVLIAGCLAASLAMGLVLAAVSLIGTVIPPKRGVFSANNEPWQRWVTTAAGVLGFTWLAATPLLIAFCRRHERDSAVARLASRLFLGTIIEAGAIIPIDVMVRRKTSCYCAEGTMWALTICWGVGTLVLGPAIWLVPLAKRRKRWFAGHCPVCEYDMSACMAAERCPECGAGWRAASNEEVKR